MHFSRMGVRIQGGYVLWSDWEAEEVARLIVQDVEDEVGQYQQMYRLHVADSVLMYTRAIPRLRPRIPRL